MIIYKNPVSILTRDDIPNGNWTNETDVYVVDDMSELGRKILSLSPFFELVLNTRGELVDVRQIADPSGSDRKLDELELVYLYLIDMDFRLALIELERG